MSVSGRNINDHPLNQASKLKMEQLGIAIDPKSAHIISLIYSLVAVHGLNYDMTNTHIIDTYLDKYCWRLDKEVLTFLLREVEEEFVDQICKEIKASKDEAELKDYLVDELIIPAIGHEYDGVFIKQHKN